jgi:hypothetical protein
MTLPRFGGDFIRARPRRPRSLAYESAAASSTRGFLPTSHTVPLLRGSIFWRDVLPNCNDAIRGHLAVRSVASAPKDCSPRIDGRGAALCWRPGSAQGRANGDTIEVVAASHAGRSGAPRAKSTAQAFRSLRWRGRDNSFPRECCSGGENERKRHPFRPQTVGGCHWLVCVDPMSTGPDAETDLLALITFVYRSCITNNKPAAAWLARE